MNSQEEMYQQKLVRALREKNQGLSERILEAFGVIPRHLFVDHYYLHTQGSRG